MSGFNNFVSVIGPTDERTWAQLPQVRTFTGDDLDILEADINTYLAGLVLPLLPDVKYSVARIDYDTTADNPDSQHSALLHLIIWQAV